MEITNKRIKEIHYELIYGSIIEGLEIPKYYFFEPDDTSFSIWINDIYALTIQIDPKRINENFYYAELHLQKINENKNLETDFLYFWENDTIKELKMDTEYLNDLREKLRLLGKNIVNGKLQNALESLNLEGIENMWFDI